MQQTLDTLSKQQISHLIGLADKSIGKMVEGDNEFSASGVDWSRKFLRLSIINEALRGLGCKSAMAGRLKIGPKETLADLIFAIRVNRQVFSLGGEVGWKSIEDAAPMKAPSPSVDRNFCWEEMPREKFERSHPIAVVNIDPEDPAGALMDKLVGFTQRDIEAHLLSMKAKPVSIKHTSSSRL